MAAAMAGIDNTASLAAAQAGITRDAARRLDAVFRGGAGLLSILVLLIAWEAFARSGKVTAFMLPPFSAVAERIYADAVAGELWRNLGVTMFRALTGFVIAAVGGVALGAMMARNKGSRGRQARYVVVDALRSESAGESRGRLSPFGRASHRGPGRRAFDAAS